MRHTLRPWRDRVPVELHATRIDRYKWKEVLWADLCPPERLRQDQRRCLQEFLAMHPSLARVYELRQRFRQTLREHLGAELDPWLQEAGACGLAPFERLAKTLTADRAAVLAAVELPWSTGRVEGIITRPKLVKRLGYGRASMPLPETIRRRAEQVLFALCQLRVPDGARDHYRLEFRVRANAVTLYECHAPWRPGQPWSRMPSAQFRFDPVRLAWTLYWADRNGRWHLYDDAMPTPDLAMLLAEVNADPTGILFG